MKQGLRPIYWLCLPRAWCSTRTITYRPKASHTCRYICTRELNIVKGHFTNFHSHANSWQLCAQSTAPVWKAPAGGMHIKWRPPPNMPLAVPSFALLFRSCGPGLTVGSRLHLLWRPLLPSVFGVAARNTGRGPSFGLRVQPVSIVRGLACHRRCSAGTRQASGPQGTSHMSSNHGTTRSSQHTQSSWGLREAQLNAGKQGTRYTRSPHKRPIHRPAAAAR